MARHILDYWELNYYNDPPEHSVELIQAAILAARDGPPHIRFGAEKARILVFCYLGQFQNAAAALQRAASLGNETSAKGLHDALIEFASAIMFDIVEEPERAARHAEAAIAKFEANGAHDRALRVYEHNAFRCWKAGEFVSALTAYSRIAVAARTRRSAPDLARAYKNIAYCYQALAEFPAARRYFTKAARVYRLAGLTMLEGKALRSVIRMSIRMRGDAAAQEMDAVKNWFLGVGAAGEVCRSTLAIIEDLLLREPNTDVTSYCRQLHDEATFLGVPPEAVCAIRSLEAAANQGNVTPEILDETWETFGPMCGISAVSAVPTTRN